MKNEGHEKIKRLKVEAPYSNTRFVRSKYSKLGQGCYKGSTTDFL